MAAPITSTPGQDVLTAKGIAGAGRTRRRARTLRGVASNWQLYAMLAVPMAWLIIYQYVPMYGIQIAFRDYRPIDGFAGFSNAEWVGFEHFQRFFTSYNFWPIIRNTLILNFYSLLAGFPLPIILALSLYYVGSGGFRRSVQMISYAPHFISTVVMVGLILQFVATDGLINQLLGVVGVGPINFMAEPQYWKSLYVWSGVWQNVGFGCIIYLAALAGVDPTLHEAAIVDGATKLQRIRDIDIPGIMPVAVILLILNMGTLLSTGFEKVLLLQNNLNLGTSEVIDTYVYRVGLASQVPQFSYAAAIGLFKAVVGMAMLIAVNQLARRMKVASLW